MGDGFGLALDGLHSAGVEVDRSASSKEAAGRDFGGLVTGEVVARVRPDGEDQLLRVVDAAAAHGMPIVARACGTSQSGQSVPRKGVSVDMAAFDGVSIDVERGVARCGCAATWREVFEAAAAVGLAPEVVPLNLNLSVGGTLSAGGMGSTSHRYGMACSSVEEVRVVTGAAQLVVASRDAHRDLYDCVLGGVGQFGFITEASIRLRPLGRQTRTAYLLYDELEALVADQSRLMGDPLCVHMEGFASAAVQGMRRLGDGRVPFARWFYGMHVSVEFDDEVPRGFASVIDGLSARERVHIESTDSVEYAGRYEGRFRAMRATGAWNQVHPWFECTVPRAKVPGLLSETIASLPLILGDGHRIMPVADAPRPRFLQVAADTPAWGIAVLPMGVPQPFVPTALAALQTVHERLTAAGGKRYLSGWLFEPTPQFWSLHFGELLAEYQACKRRFDPAGVLRSLLLDGT